MSTKISVIGLVSAFVHSHIYWIYSIIYIIYLKMNPGKQVISQAKAARKKSLKYIPPPPTVIPTIITEMPLPAPVIRQRKLHRRSSTGQLFKKRLSTLLEVDAQSFTDVDTISLSDSNSSNSSNTEHVSKRDRTLGLLRSKFQKSYSTNDIHSLNQPTRRRKRDAILVIFSGRSNPKEETIKKRTKLFRSLPSWKKA